MKSTITTMVASLTVLTVAAAAILALVRIVSAPYAEEARAARLNDALVEVLPPFDTIEADSIDGLPLYRAFKDGDYAGAAVQSFSDAGFSGHIDVLFGFDNNGALQGYTVLNHSETPGLGAKMDDWFRQLESAHNVIGTTTELKVSKDGGDIDAITGATISSRAFLEALNRARNAAQAQ